MTPSSTSRERFAALAFWCVPGVTRSRLEQLRAAFGSLSEALGRPARDWSRRSCRRPSPRLRRGPRRSASGPGSLRGLGARVAAAGRCRVARALRGGPTQAGRSLPPRRRAASTRRCGGGIEADRRLRPRSRAGLWRRIGGRGRLGGLRRRARRRWRRPRGRPGRGRRRLHRGGAGLRSGRLLPAPAPVRCSSEIASPRHAPQRVPARNRAARPFISRAATG